VSHDRAVITRARYLAAQAREPVPYYEHLEVGYTYRMSNLLAALGLGQLKSLPTKLAKRRRINERYRNALATLPGLSFMPEAAYGRSNCWLTCVRVDSAQFGVDRERVRLYLDSCDIEARPVWKPMHLQPVFRGCTVRGGEIAARVFDQGLCLPSGSSLSEGDQRRVISALEELREIERSREVASLRRAIAV
jgi:dTDP-4-amino-4,6-dideoxygalactose transaminase